MFFKFLLKKDRANLAIPGKCEQMNPELNYMIKLQEIEPF